MIEPEEGVVGFLDLLPSQREGWVSWGPTTCDWHLKWGQSCGTEPLTMGSALTPGGYYQN